MEKSQIKHNASRIIIQQIATMIQTFENVGIKLTPDDLYEIAENFTEIIAQYTEQEKGEGFLFWMIRHNEMLKEAEELRKQEIQSN
jgi:hemerythrin-like domain-containing protein